MEKTSFEADSLQIYLNIWHIQILAFIQKSFQYNGNLSKDLNMINIY